MWLGLEVSHTHPGNAGKILKMCETTWKCWKLREKVFETPGKSGKRFGIIWQEIIDKASTSKACEVPSSCVREPWGCLRGALEALSTCLRGACVRLHENRCLHENLDFRGIRIEFHGKFSRASNDVQDELNRKRRCADTVMQDIAGYTPRKTTPCRHMSCITNPTENNFVQTTSCRNAGRAKQIQQKTTLCMQRCAAALYMNSTKNDSVLCMCTSCAMISE